MSLKGYEWLDANQEVIMTFTFKDLTIDVWKDTTKEELDNFRKWLKENGWEERHLECHGHKIASPRPGSQTDLEA